MIIEYYIFALIAITKKETINEVIKTSYPCSSWNHWGQ